jgi:hypothetical protein
MMVCSLHRERCQSKKCPQKLGWFRNEKGRNISRFYRVISTLYNKKHGHLRCIWKIAQDNTRFLMTTTDIQIDYENPWIYNGLPFTTNQIEDYFGFVYLIRNTINHRIYIGRKYFWSFRTPPGKSRKSKAESDWKKYYGSCPELKEDIKLYGKLQFSRTILSLHKTKGITNFEETRQLFVNKVLTEAMEDGSPAYYNSNILGRYMRKDYFRP